MLLSRILYRLVLPVVAVLALVAGPAAAQPPRIPADAKGFQVAQLYHNFALEMMRKDVASTAVAAPAKFPALTPAISVVVGEPRAYPTYVDIRGPDGEVRRFALHGGVQTPHVIVLRAGESAHVNFVASAK